MKSILILVASLSLFVGCSKKLPAYPEELKEFHMVLIKGSELSEELTSRVTNLEDLESAMDRSSLQVECLHFNVVRINPYEFDFTGVVPLKSCHEVAGYKPDENVKLWNWVDDVLRFADENKCFDKKD